VSLGLNDDATLIGMISRVQRWKGQHHLLHAIAALRDEGVNCHGILVGGDAYNLDPTYNVEIANLRVSLGLQDRLTWIDHVDDPRPYLYALDIFVNASVRENLSLALLEAMAAGRCIVAVADGGTPEAIVDGRSGLLLERSDSLLLAQALSRLCKDPGARARLAANARTEYERGFTAEGWARAVEERIDVLCRLDFRHALAKVARSPR
jgi:glycosyltransferase involved in cell wall biosynthesis